MPVTILSWCWPVIWRGQAWGLWLPGRRWLGPAGISGPAQPSAGAGRTPWAGRDNGHNCYCLLSELFVSILKKTHMNNFSSYITKVSVPKTINLSKKHNLRQKPNFQMSWSSFAPVRVPLHAVGVLPHAVGATLHRIGFISELFLYFVLYFSFLYINLFLKEASKTIKIQMKSSTLKS